MPFLFSLLVTALTIFAVVDIIRRDDAQVRFVPKLVWIIVVILLPLIGALLWFGLGREYSEAGLRIPRMRRRAPRRQAAPPATPPAAPRDTRSTEQQIEDLDREIEEWRLRAELDKRREDDGEQPTP